MKLLNIILGHITLQLSKKHVRWMHAISSVIDLSNIHFTVFLPQQRCIALLACAFIKRHRYGYPIGSFMLGSLSTTAIKFADAKHGPNTQDNKQQG